MGSSSLSNAASVKLSKNLGPFINGEFFSKCQAKPFSIYNPSTDELLCQVQMAGQREMDLAIASAREAFDKGPWRDSTGQSRGRVLLKIAEVIRQNAQDLAQLETLNMGKPIVEAEYDVADAVSCFEYFAGWATKIFGDVNPVPDNAMSFTVKEPIGVCGLIIPWNYPLLMAAWKLAPAIAAGCTMILKPAEATPLSVLRLAELLREIPELPPGVVNIVPGYGEEVGQALAQSPLVDKIAFTGSTEVGRAIMTSAAQSNLKKVTLELGGKSPNIFFADSNFEAAVEGALFGCFVNQGEVCSAGSRIFVEKKIHDRFLEAMVKKAKTIAVGDGFDRTNKMGPLVTKEHFERVLGFVQAGKSEGAKLEFGGGKVEGLKGYYLQPTIFSQVKNSMSIAQEEIFGPVASVIPFDGEEEAIELANATRFGLAGAVWTRDIYRAFRVVRKVRAGILWVNHMQPTFVEAPWGGYKQSGTGRELGRYGVENFLESKLVHINLTDAPMGWY